MRFAFGLMLLLFIVAMLGGGLLVLVADPPPPRDLPLIAGLLCFIFLTGVAVVRILLSNPAKYRYSLETEPIDNDLFFEAALGYLRTRTTSFCWAVGINLVISILLIIYFQFANFPGQVALFFKTVSFFLPVGISWRLLRREMQTRQLLNDLELTGESERLALLVSAMERFAREPLAQLIVRRLSEGNELF